MHIVGSKKFGMREKSNLARRITEDWAIWTSSG